MNLDKYEGHTPAPWRISDEEIEVEGWAEVVARGLWRVCVLTELAKRDDPDIKLIAAAPDLLAEVKRLREGIKRMAENCEYNSNPYLGDALKELIE